MIIIAVFGCLKIDNKMPITKQIQLLIVFYWGKFLNFWLSFARFLLFFPFDRKRKNSKNILIYKIGNIGDIVCAVPSFIAIRRNFPQAKITLLTSPGKRGAIGAKELLPGVWYLDEIKVYYSDEIDSWTKKKQFIGDLRGNNYDLFIQLPDDLANFRTLFRNMIFAKLIGVKSAFGFKIRTVQLFKKTQVDYTTQETEVESLLNLLRENELKVEKVEYDFNISEKQKEKVKNLLKEKWGHFDKLGIIVAISFGGKRESNRWPLDNFKKIAKCLQDRHNAKIIIVGGLGDVSELEFIKKGLDNKNVLIAAGKLDILETFELLKHCSFLISNSTGTIHLAAAVDVPAVGLYTIRDVFGRWFPYGKNHQVLYHKFLDCNYKKERCIKKSIEMIMVEEVKNACEKIIQRIKQN